jgi:hypothetical protein
VADLPNRQPARPLTTLSGVEPDNEIKELRRRFSTASTPQDYRAVGSHCVGVLEALSRTVYDPTKPGSTVVVAAAVLNGL